MTFGKDDHEQLISNNKCLNIIGQEMLLCRIIPQVPNRVFWTMINDNVQFWYILRWSNCTVYNLSNFYLNSFRSLIIILDKKNPCMEQLWYDPTQHPKKTKSTAIAKNMWILKYWWTVSLIVCLPRRLRVYPSYRSRPRGDVSTRISLDAVSSH